MLEIGGIYKLSKVVEYRDTKYGVCVCVSESMFFLVNTQNRKHHDSIVLYKKHQRPFPEHDSYLNCKEAFEVETDQVGEKIAKLEIRELREVLEKVENSQFLTDEHIDIISEALKNKLNPVNK